MSSRHRILARLWAPVLAVLAALTAGGCSSSSPEHGNYAVFAPFDTVIFVPVPGNPEGVLRGLEYCYTSRDTGYHSKLYTDDYRFIFSARDPGGNAWRNTPWTREDELAYFEHLVNGGGANGLPRASRIHLILDRNFLVTPNP